ncbi:hypothetical protein [Methylomonas koyamae]|uniref:hypothetical protein n=1 Tax=Methylomonas koyamae TaxID=702114 RepID=UPI00112E9B66|nr:hypothetical protein [Methylomonas koyamae]TPQ29834.1 hypothetical protein C2U68_00575 [Methylomonas koyamae]
MNLKNNAIRLLTLLLVLLAMVSQTANAAPVNVDLTSGTWLVSGGDTSGVSWNGSTLVFETQIAIGDSLSLTGYFDWVGSNGSFGRERFTGTLFANREIELSGFEIVQPARGIGLTNYFAELAVSGTEIINGTWSGPVIPSNNWSARLAPAPVPLPAAVWPFLSGLIAIAAFRSKKRP